MILDQGKQSEVLSDMENTVDMTIDKTNPAVLMMILSQGLYSDPIGSLVRELTTNALDSHIEAKNTEPIIVSLKREEGNYVFSVQDFGVGLSPERVENIFTKYAASTKRESNDQYGAFGLGSKSPLAYRDNFYIISRHEGTEYKYMMFKGDEGTKLSLLDMNETTEKNGVTIKVPLKAWNDFQQFINKIRQQLSYFEGVYFDIEGGFNNDFKIVKSDNWKYSEMCNDTKMHICLDNVYYPIDWSKLEIDAISVPIGLNFSVTDGLMPTPNRENVIYNPAVKQLVKDKISAVLDGFIDTYNKTTECETFQEAMKLHFNEGKVKISEHTALEVNVKELGKKLDKEIAPITLKKYPLLNMSRLVSHRGSFLSEYRITLMIQNGRYTSKEIDERIPEMNYNVVVMPTGATPTRLQVDYLKDMGENFYFARFHKRKLGWNEGRFSYDSHSYKAILGLNKYPKDQWREMIKQFEELKKEFTTGYLMLEEVVPDAKWLEERKARRKKGSRRTVDKTEVRLALSRKSDTFGHQYPVYDKISVFELRTLPQSKGFFVYATKEDREALERFYKIGVAMYSSKIGSRLKTVIVNNRDFEKIKAQKFHNWKTMEEVLSEKYGPLVQYVTSLVVEKFIEDHSKYFNNSMFIGKLSKSTLMDMVAIKKYMNDTFNGHQGRYYSYSDDVNHEQSLIELFMEKGWLDPRVSYLIPRLTKSLKHFDFIQHFGNLTSASVPVALELLTYRRLKAKMLKEQEAEQDINQLIVNMQGLQQEDEADEVDYEEDATEMTEEEIAAI